MSKDVNRVVLKGRVGAKPVLRYMPSGDAVCTLSLVTRYGNHDEWHKLVGYYENAEQASREFDQGDTIYFEGYIRTRYFQTEEDKKAGRQHKRSVLEIVADLWTVVRKSKRGETEPSVSEDNPAAPHDSDERETEDQIDVPPKPLSYL
ncbi:single-stranded DNA-binding protein [Burkholderia vietnamiensis]|uniref:single-stranded DNA-binding protein n=1 Tax=Burkholderia vietnamiensis TaxID=60552 RepID=UPI001594DB9A|nr:single-stranded DNA-binding protein [Burkholderia vietnamiensis]MCA8270386.1 single-stranded DNA-binding protein [Burkholderia vietnamiensis]